MAMEDSISLHILFHHFAKSWPESRGSGQLFYCLQKIHKIRGRFPDFEGRIEVRVEKGNKPSLRQFNTVLPAAAGRRGTYAQAALAAKSKKKEGI